MGEGDCYSASRLAIAFLRSHIPERFQRRLRSEVTDLDGDGAPDLTTTGDGILQVYAPSGGR
jgi:hypothetical protein